MKNADYRRQMGMGMPAGPHGVEASGEIIKTGIYAPKPKQLNFQIVMGIWMVDDGDGWRSPTAEELEEMTGGVMCYELHDHVTLLGKS